MESHEKVEAPEIRESDCSLNTSAATAECAGAEVETAVNNDCDNVKACSTDGSPDGVEDAPQREPLRMSDVMARLESLAAGDGADVTADETGRLKQQFYGLVNEVMAVQRDEHVAAGNDPETFTPVPVPEEPRFKELMQTLKELRNNYRIKVEAEQQSNLERKQAIVDELMRMASDTDNVNRHYPRAKDLQAEFKAVGEVPQQNTTQIWKAFQDAVEHFYDQWKVNKELRDYDFKKNLGEKQLLIDEAEALLAEEDIVLAFRRLQDLHDKWRETGPVAKELRDEIWSKFKDASAEINKRYQAFFEERKQRELQNEAAKTALCETVEGIDLSNLKSFASWGQATERIMEAQRQWKELGYASRKINNQLFARFRATCDAFFAAKADFFKEVKAGMADNLAAKTRLCEQAEALMDSTDWRRTSDEIVELQKKWKAIGAVTRKQSDAVWHRFMTACNTFFDRKKKATSEVRRNEQANLKVKRGIVERLTALNTPGCDTERSVAIKEINELRESWQSTGHVPFREKDKLHEVYRELVRQLFDKYDINEKRARMNSFRDNIDAVSGDRDKLLRERDRMIRAYEGRKSELATYENNLSFLSARSRSGASVLGEIERNIQRLKNSITELEAKIKLVDSKLAE